MAEKSSDASSSDTACSPQHEENKSGGGWWDSWLSSAKTKSAEVYSMVKKDLDEIGTAVKSEASHVFSTTSNVIGKTLKLDEPESPANVMKKSFSTFIGQVSTVLSPEPDDEDDTEVILSSGDTTMLSTYKKELEALQRVDATFIVPAYSPEFDAWRGTEAGLISPSGAIRRLDANPVLKAQYDKLVSDAVSHEDFWERYLFRVALLQDKLAAASRKQPLEEPTADPVLDNLPLQTHEQQSQKMDSPTKSDTDAADFDAVAWEDEAFLNDMELTEEQQILLLEEYEREISSKKTSQSKQTSPRDLSNNNTKDKTTITKADKKTKGAQTRGKMNNKQTEKKQNYKTNKAQKKSKADECGNNLVEDYFGETETRIVKKATFVKRDAIIDDGSANSDESWEKEFDMEEVQNA